jgi:quinol monooxygenase YgiN
MYGTVARFRLKPGMKDDFLGLLHEYHQLRVPGLVAEYVYQMDADPDEYYLVVAFESKEAYFANANRPEQDARYRRLRELMAEDPEWHDGEVLVATAVGPGRLAAR